MRGELVVRHEGQERVIDFSGGRSRIHFAAFYADCEHSVRPLRKGHRLCLIYNLTLKKGKKLPSTPRAPEGLDAVRRVLRDWAKEEQPRKVVFTLEHQYTRDGLVPDALKGADGVRARVLFEAARQEDCRAYLALLTFHESGAAAEPDYGYGWRRRDEYGEDDEESVRQVRGNIGWTKCLKPL